MIPMFFKCAKDEQFSVKIKRFVIATKWVVWENQEWREMGWKLQCDFQCEERSIWSRKIFVERPSKNSNLVSK